MLTGRWKKFDNFADGLLAGTIAASLAWSVVYGLFYTQSEKLYAQVAERAEIAERKAWAAQKTVTLFGDVIFKGPRSAWEQCVLGGNHEAQ